MQSANIRRQQITVNAGHSWAVSQNSRIVIAWFLPVVILSAVVAWIYTGLCQLYPSSLLKYFFVLLFLLVSISHIFIFPKWLSHLHYTAKYMYMALMAGCISGSVFIVFTIAVFNGGMLPVAAGVASLLPFAVHTCWQNFAAMLPGYDTKCYVPAEQPETKLSLLLLNSMPLKIKIKMREADAEGIVFAVTITGKLDAGRMFCRFLYDQKGAVEVMDKNGSAYAWIFFVKKWYGLKVLDPCKSLIKNGIRENDMLVMERVVKYP